MGARLPQRAGFVAHHRGIGDIMSKWIKIAASAIALIGVSTGAAHPAVAAHRPQVCVHGAFMGGMHAVWVSPCHTNVHVGKSLTTEQITQVLTTARLRARLGRR